MGDVVACDLNTEWKEGQTVLFEQVLLVSDEGEVKVGKPALPGAKVTAEVVGHRKGKKEVVFRFKRRKNVRVKRGHRQGYTEVRITQIDA